ncbi:hypothetical protein Fmac_030039 [Flemingia macrophylla]|uniref:Uncharacterized protein n=1 Tax=Flemingia macrophylla TaxID=520843 RepID=A0ABD1LC30_9FABA
MRLPSRRVPWPTVPNSNKRKERDQASPSSKPTSPFTKLSRPRSGPEPIVPNHMLLAGYLANEFLTKGTLLGRNLGQPVNPDVESKQQKHERYVELSLFLKTEGAHLFGIVNPTQLAHFLKL